MKWVVQVRRLRQLYDISASSHWFARLLGRSPEYTGGLATTTSTPFITGRAF